MTTMPVCSVPWKRPTTKAKHDKSLELLQATVFNNPYIPHVPTVKQALFLVRPELEVFYGGSAGGGKSDALLMAALQFVTYPGYAALLLRRSFTDLALPNAIMDRAAQWLSATGARWSGETKTWTFPSGATLTFGYLEHDGDETRYQGAEFAYVGFDEATQFTERQYRFLFSRLRRLKDYPVPIRMRAASNPGNRGHEWVKARFITAKHTPGRKFIPARLPDNPYLDQAEYKKSLGLLDEVTQARLLDGNWDVSYEGGVARREWFPIVDAAPAQGKRVRFYDFAATERGAKGSDPDWTVGTLMIEHEGIYYVAHVIRERTSEVEALVVRTAQADGKAVPVAFEQEPAAGGKLFSRALINKLAGWTVRATPSTGDKLTRALPFISQARAGNVRLVRGPFLQGWIDEICAFPNGGHDDQWDSASGAFTYLTTYSGWVR